MQWFRRGQKLSKDLKQNHGDVLLGVGVLLVQFIITFFSFLAYLKLCIRVGPSQILYWALWFTVFLSLVWVCLFHSFTQVEPQYMIYSRLFFGHMSLTVMCAVVYVSNISFLLWTRTLFYKYITMCLSIYLLKDIWIVPGLGLI